MPEDFGLPRGEAGPFPRSFSGLRGGFAFRFPDVGPPSAGLGTLASPPFPFLLYW